MRPKGMEGPADRAAAPTPCESITTKKATRRPPALRRLGGAVAVKFDPLHATRRRHAEHRFGSSPAKNNRRRWSTNSTGSVRVTYLKSGPYLHDSGVSHAPRVNVFSQLRSRASRLPLRDVFQIRKHTTSPSARYDLSMMPCSFEMRQAGTGEAVSQLRHPRRVRDRIYCSI